MRGGVAHTSRSSLPEGPFRCARRTVAPVAKARRPEPRGCARVDLASRTRPNSARGCSTPRSCARTTAASTARAARASSTARRRRARAGVLQLRRPLRRRRRRRQRRARTSCGSSRGTCSSTTRRWRRASSTPAIPTDDGTPDHGHPARRRRLHLPQPTRVRPAAPGARCTSPRSRPASARSTGSPTSAGRCRSGSSTRPTRTATSRHACGSGSGATGARAATTSTGGAPRRPRRSSAIEPVYRSARDEIVDLVGQEIYDLMVQLLERPNWTPCRTPTRR